MTIENKEIWRRLLKESYNLALSSRDPSTQNGAILVDIDYSIVSTGCNQFPAGVEENPTRWERPLKYKFIEHAERKVIYNACKNGVKTEGLTMVCGWAACTDCGRAIIESGIKRLVTHRHAHELSPLFW